MGGNTSIRPEHATGEGMYKGYKWLQDAFEEYFNAPEQRVEKGATYSFGGASYSDHNRTVFAAEITQALRYNEHGYEDPRLTDEQFDKLTDSLQWIKAPPTIIKHRSRFTPVKDVNDYLMNKE